MRSQGLRMAPLERDSWLFRLLRRYAITRPKVRGYVDFGVAEGAELVEDGRESQFDS